jgi:molybdopterin-guanine dinucleotide biosynthesis protein B
MRICELNMRVFAVSGYSFSGKTFLIEQLVKALRAKGHTVASVKSSQEDSVAPDGTDTWRHSKAGADPTILLGPNSTTIRYSNRLDWGVLLRSGNADFLLIEGMKSLDVPKFWCVGERSRDEGQPPNGTKAIVIWEGESYDRDAAGIPVIPNIETERLTDIVISEAVDINTL